VSESFLDFYLDYSKETEPPYNYHRWCAISGVGALLGRSFYLQFGRNKVHTNLYTMLVGESGSRKSTAIRGVASILRSSGYTTIAADNTTKEKFLMDLQGETEDLLESGSRPSPYDRSTSENLWGAEATHDGEPRCILIAADEFNDFTGVKNIEFYSMLGQLWDYEGVYQRRIKNGRSIAVPDPTISILAGNTAQNIVTAFPPELIGQGFLSRLLFIHGVKSERKYHIPPTPPPEQTKKCIDFLKEIQLKMRGEATVDSAADKMLEAIYKGWPELLDVRFRNYSTRRYTQLVKIALIRAASRFSKTITTDDVIYANTCLSAAEHNMPKALGEFGKGRHSAIADIVMRILSGDPDTPKGIKDFWKEVHKDLDKPADLAIIIQSLEQAEKIHHVKIDGKSAGWMLRAGKHREEKFVDWSLLTQEERQLL
jgi:energy-coupling factor transporter ATP-binding protein EcfA2